MPIVVFNMNKEGNLLKLITGEKIGTLVLAGEKKKVVSGTHKPRRGK
jgi:hypothetical protein